MVTQTKAQGTRVEDTNFKSGPGNQAMGYFTDKFAAELVRDIGITCFYGPRPAVLTKPSGQSRS